MGQKKTRVDFRKNRNKPAREKGWTGDFKDHGFAEEATEYNERVRSKGELSRKRTVVDSNEGAPTGTESVRLLKGRVLKVQGLHSMVEGDDGATYRCAIRRLLKTLSTDERHVVATGDIVHIRPAGKEGMIERIEPRHGVLTRDSRGREHVLVANVDQVIIVVSLLEPELKPHLIDRYLAAAHRGRLAPVVCLNKADLLDHDLVQPLIGSYARIGIPVILTSASTGTGIEELRHRLAGKASVISGQSGVGKSSLLNAVQDGLGLRVRSVSAVNSKGRHTTTTAELVKLESGGWVIDTPGVRTLALFNVAPGEVEGFFPEFHPFVARCGFPDCTHRHEERCAVKHAVARRLISARRYTSYIGLFESASESSS